MNKSTNQSPDQWKEQYKTIQQSWTEQGTPYMTDNVKNVIISIVESNQNATTTNKQQLTNSLINKFTMLLGNQNSLNATMISHANDKHTYTIESHSGLFFEQEFLTLVFGLNKGDNRNTINTKIKAFYNNIYPTNKQAI